MKQSQSVRERTRINTIIFLCGGRNSTFKICPVAHRGTMCWWEDHLEERATKEKQSVDVQRHIVLNKYSRRENKRRILLLFNSG